MGKFTASDPVHKDTDDGKWYFYMETWHDRYGPYNSEEECRGELDKYVKANGLG